LPSICIPRINGSPVSSVNDKDWLRSFWWFGIALIVAPTWLLMNSFADSVQRFVGAVQENTLHIPAPPESVKNLPLVGNKIHAGWSKAQTDLPGVVKTMQPKIGDLARQALSMVASVGGAMLLFMASFVVATSRTRSFC